MVPDIWSGVWWAITTMTTVGYGDIAPATGQGRVVGGILMVFGVALMASFSGYLASFLVAENDDSSQDRVQEQLDQMQAQLDQIQARLSEIVERLP